MDARSFPRTRRSLLTAAAAAGGALATQALVRPSPVAAANVVLGAVNSANAVTTIRNTAASNSAKAIVGLVTYTGPGGPTVGVHGQSNAANGTGVFGVAAVGGSRGVWGRSVRGPGVYGEATGTTGANTGVYGKSLSSHGRGVVGEGNHGVLGIGGAYGVLAFGNDGVQGQGNATNGTGIYGVAMQGSNSRGVWGRSLNGFGVYGEATGTTGTNYGVYGESNGVQGIGARGIGHHGVYGTSNTENGSGVFGAGGTGVWGRSTNGKAMLGQAVGSTAYNFGVYGESSSSHGTGVYGRGIVGVNGQGTLGVAGTVGVHGSGKTGVHGVGNTGIYGTGTFYAGWFDGTTHVAGTFTATVKSFLIDHPQDPANRTLAHACVEAPEMLNVYRGTVVLDANGRATVRLPRYFRTLNTEYGYQLTAIGVPAPTLHVYRKVLRSSFAIAGGAAGQEVCWIVTGQRQDAWAKANPLRVDKAKRPRDRGRYLNPEVHGQPKSAAINRPPKVQRVPNRRRRRREHPAA